MNRQSTLLCLVLFATACGPGAAPNGDESGKANGAPGREVSASLLTDPAIFTLWDGLDCTRDEAAWYLYENTPMVMPNTSSFFDNDEAKSMRLFDMPAGTIIRVYDSPSGSHSDDWSEIVINSYAEDLCIGNLETPADNSAFSLRHCHFNGLNGKVSSARIQSFAFSGDDCTGGTWMNP